MKTGCTFRYKNKSYRAMVEICRTTSQLEDYCRQVCIKLECCPNLISPHFVGDNCPEHCSQLTKTKYSEYLLSMPAALCEIAWMHVEGEIQNS